jgi:hypothetical protein
MTGSFGTEGADTVSFTSGCDRYGHDPEPRALDGLKTWGVIVRSRFVYVMSATCRAVASRAGKPNA